MFCRKLYLCISLVCVCIKHCNINKFRYRIITGGGAAFSHPGLLLLTC